MNRATPGIALGAVGLGALFALGVVAPTNPDFDVSFGVENWRAAGLVALIAAESLLLIILVVPGVADRLSGAIGSIGRHVPLRLRMPLFLAASGAAFLLLPTAVISGDAPEVIQRVALREVYPSNALTCWIMNLTADLTGLDPATAISVVAVLAGLVYARAAVGIARECFEDTGRRAGMIALLLTCGPVALFFGSIEVYAPLAAGIAVYIHTGLRSLSRRGPAWLPPLVLGVAFSLHGAAGLLLPSLAILSNGGRVRPLHPGRLLSSAGLFLLPVAATFGVLYFVTWGGVVPPPGADRYGTFLGGMEQGPLLPLALSYANLTHRYALLDAHHLLGVLNLLILAAPAGLVLFAAGRRDRGPDRTWLLWIAAFLVAFPVFWNVNFPLRRDWDLFSAMGIPLTVLGGLAFLSSAPRPGAAAVRVATLSLFCFVPVVLTATGARFERRRAAGVRAESIEAAASRATDGTAGRLHAQAAPWWERTRALDPHSVVATFHRATRLYHEGRHEDAAREYRRAYDLSPKDSAIAGDLGVTLYGLGQRAQGRGYVEESIRLHPMRMKPRLDLARMLIDEGDEIEAMRVLERGIRAAITDQRWAVEALRLLRRLERKYGDREHVEILTGFLTERGAR